MKKLLILIGFVSSSFAANNTLLACKYPVVELSTNLGKIEIRLNKIKAPITSANFLAYVNSGFYTNKIFHRVIPSFMIQGGGFDAKLQAAKTRSPIKNEANNGLNNDKYTIAMARTNQPNSATSQFFINVNNNKFLNYTKDNPGYAVFGKVVKGLAVVDKIALVKTHSVGIYDDVPEGPVIITNSRLLSCAKGY